MIKRSILYTVLLLVVFGFSATVSAGNKRRLANGYILDPAGTGLATELAKFFKGYTQLRKTGTGCKSEVIRYIEVGSEDKFFQWVVRTADQGGNRNGTAEVAELQAIWNTACTNRGK